LLVMKGTQLLQSPAPKKVKPFTTPWNLKHKFCRHNRDIVGSFSWKKHKNPCIQEIICTRRQLALQAKQLRHSQSDNILSCTGIINVTAWIQKTIVYVTRAAIETPFISQRVLLQRGCTTERKKPNRAWFERFEKLRKQYHNCWNTKRDQNSTPTFKNACNGKPWDMQKREKAETSWSKVQESQSTYKSSSIMTLLGGMANQKYPSSSSSTQWWMGNRA
jgi:hypothetical protein